MASTTLTELRARVLERADMVGTSFVSTTELDAIINGEGGELHDLVVGLFEDQFTTQYAFALAAGASFALASLPSSAPFYKLRGVDRARGDGSFFALDRFEWSDRNRFRAASCDERSIRYRLVGALLTFAPVEATAGNYVLWYVPAYVRLAAPSDALDYPEEWVEFVIAGAAAKCLAKEESDPSIQLGLKAATKARIQAMGQNRDASGPERVERVRERRNRDFDAWDDE